MTSRIVMQRQWAVAHTHTHTHFADFFMGSQPHTVSLALFQRQRAGEEAIEEKWKISKNICIVFTTTSLTVDINRFTLSHNHLNMFGNENGFESFWFHQLLPYLKHRSLLSVFSHHFCRSKKNELIISKSRSEEVSYLGFFGGKNKFN